ncbi:MAG: hypothetical protein J1F03_00425 [Oscillospiraceae bacterium]|nr:hypothetical protein [Oscillospiraceae bacterium]
MNKKIKHNTLIRNLLNVFILCVFVFSVSGCSAYTYLKDKYTNDSSSKRHLSSSMRWNEDKMLFGFNKEQKNRILEAFNVVIPENEEEAYVYSFYFSEENDYLKFILEIDGVKDYDAFFQANSGRVKENGLLGKSMNEVLDPYPSMTAYYITYEEFFYSEAKLQTDEDKEMIFALSALYNELKEEVPNGTKIDYTASLIKYIVVILLNIFVFGVAAVIFIVCFMKKSLKRHLFTWTRNKKENALFGFTKDQEKRILEAFNVVIPKNEQAAYVYSFCFSKDDVRHLNFTLEIDGVKDYNAFFLANSFRVKEDGLAGKSSNEIVKRCLPKKAYFITYEESFFARTGRQSDEDKAIISVLRTLYDELKEEMTADK